MENKNQPAFPEIKEISKTAFAKNNNPSDNYHSVISKGGLTKREYFAAMAMQGFIMKYKSIPGEGNEPKPDYENIAGASVILADELLTALDKTK